MFEGFDIDDQESIERLESEYMSNAWEEVDQLEKLQADEDRRKNKEASKVKHLQKKAETEEGAQKREQINKLFSILAVVTKPLESLWYSIFAFKARAETALTNAIYQNKPALNELEKSIASLQALQIILEQNIDILRASSAVDRSDLLKNSELLDEVRKQLQKAKQLANIRRDVIFTAVENCSKATASEAVLKSTLDEAFGVCAEMQVKLLSGGNLLFIEGEVAKIQQKVALATSSISNPVLTKENRVPDADAEMRVKSALGSLFESHKGLLDCTARTRQLISASKTPVKIVPNLKITNRAREQVKKICSQFSPETQKSSPFRLL